MGNTAGVSPHPVTPHLEFATPSQRRFPRALTGGKKPAVLVKSSHRGVPLGTLTPRCPPCAAKTGGVPGVCGAEPAQPPSWGCAGVWGCWKRGRVRGCYARTVAWPGEGVDTEGKKQEQAWDCCDLGPDQPSPERCKVGERLSLAFPAVPLV